MLSRYESKLRAIDPIKVKGRISKVIGMVMESNGPYASLGDLCYIRSRDKKYRAEVIGFRDNRVLLMPLNDIEGVSPGCVVIATGTPLTIKVGDGLLGRVLNGLGQPIDGKGDLKTEEKHPVHNSPPRPLKRERITEHLATGIRAIDGLLTLGKGQRMGVFAGSGVGKSILLGMIARNTEADVNVIALIGERGREVRDFIERDLGEEGLSRSVVVAVTSDESPLIRLKGAFVATAIAEYFRDKGKDVLLIMDSITRVAMAQREIGLAVGEPPTTKGYTPSTFTLLPKLLERAGKVPGGSITGLYAVLVEGDDLSEPVSDASRSILDGHIVLSRKLASSNHYPAIDPLQSVSRVMIDVVDEGHFKTSRRILELLATYRDAEDLINIGAYVRGSNPKIDHAISMIDRVNEFLKQGIYEKAPFEETKTRLMELASQQGETSKA